MQTGGTVVIVGFGWVGQANALALSRMGFHVSYFDPGNPSLHYTDTYADAYGRITRLSGVLERDAADTAYIVCVGDKVAEDGTQDISAIRAALESLKDAKGAVVLRSTVIPDLLESLNFDFYMPEFLHEKTAVEECLSPHFFVLGIRDTKTSRPAFFDAWQRATPLQFGGTPREAAFVKYLSNLWNATRIAFVNEFGDAIAEPSTPQDVDSISRVLNFVLGGEGYTRYGRAFGGHCLPKDTRAFVKWFGEQGKNVDLLRGVYASNAAHEALSVRHPALPEWFSAWQTPHMSGFVAWRELWFSLYKNISDPREFLARYWRPFLVLAAAIVVIDAILLLAF
ncbi:MAG TPA: hypothetical protein VHD55_04030 [Candidatus Paceibacterota bacterium]|nr:hypothetical protein [Candidatus Paceibacterota bacterium]